MDSVVCKYCNELVTIPRQKYINKNTLTFYYVELRHINCKNKPQQIIDKKNN